MSDKRLSKVSLRELPAAAKDARGRARAAKPKTESEKQRLAADKALMTKVKQRFVVAGVRGATIEIGTGH